MGTSTVTAVGRSIFSGVGSASGISSASSVGRSTAVASGLATGETIVNGVGGIIATFTATGVSTGTSTASAQSFIERKLKEVMITNIPMKTIVNVISPSGPSSVTVKKQSSRNRVRIT
jgi:hypothetical protein